MKIIELNESHISTVVSFLKSKNLSNYYVDDFCYTFLVGLQTFHAYGAFSNDGTLLSIMGYYESIDEASWFLTRVYGKNRLANRNLLDTITKLNEQNGIFKWYIKSPHRTKNKDTIWRYIASKEVQSKYIIADEYIVGEKQKCKYTLVWQVLYDRILDNNETVVKCVFLKPEHRPILHNVGGIY